MIHILLIIKIIGHFMWNSIYKYCGTYYPKHTHK